MLNVSVIAALPYFWLQQNDPIWHYAVFTGCCAGLSASPLFELVTGK